MVRKMDDSSSLGLRHTGIKAWGQFAGNSLSSAGMRGQPNTQLTEIRDVLPARGRQSVHSS